MTLIERLRTGTHEQAWGLLLECYKAIFPHYSDLPVGSEERHEAILHKGKFESLLYINTPEACVGAAMMLMPEGFSFDLTKGWRCDVGKGVSTAVVADKQYGPSDITGHCDGAETPALALAAAIMETRNG